MNRWIKTFASLSVLAAITACTAQPLYGTVQSDRGQTPLGIEIKSPADRNEQLVRNALLERTGSSAISTAYTGEIKASVFSGNVFLSNTPDTLANITNQSVEVTATLIVRNTDTAETAASFRGVGRTFYERSRQQFANDRAKIDATRRAAEDAAASLATQLQVFLRDNPTAASSK